MAISLLTGMSDILGTLTSELTQSSLQIMELSQFLCLSTPFGTPSETNPTSIKLQVQFRKANTIPKEKVSAPLLITRHHLLNSDSFMETCRL